MNFKYSQGLSRDSQIVSNKIGENRAKMTLGALKILSVSFEVFFKSWILLSKTLNSLGLSRGFAIESLRVICKYLKLHNSHSLKNSPPYGGRLRSREPAAQFA